MHHAAAAEPRGLDGEADEFDSKVEHSIRLRDRKSVTEPCADVVQGIDPHRANDLTIDERDEMQGLRVFIVGVLVRAHE